MHVVTDFLLICVVSLKNLGISFMHVYGYSSSLLMHT